MEGNRRTNDDGKINSILLIDNEHENVADLEILLKRKCEPLFAENQRVEYTASPDEATRLMMDKMKNKEGYSAIVCDDHMDKDMESETDTIEGQDFLRILKGGMGYCLSSDRFDLNLGNFSRFRSFEELAEEILGKTSMRRSSHKDSIIRYAKRNFKTPNIYNSFLEYYTARSVEAPILVMLTGHPNDIDESGLDRIDIIGKGTRNCEIAVADIFQDEGIITLDDLAGQLEEHPRWHDGECRRYNPRAPHVKKLVRRKKHY